MREVSVHFGYGKNDSGARKPRADEAVALAAGGRVAARLASAPRCDVHPFMGPLPASGCALCASMHPEPPRPSFILRSRRPRPRE